MYKLIMEELKEKATAQTKKTLMRHGIEEPLFGVLISESKKIIKKYKIQNNNEIAFELFNSKNYDAMYLACLVMKAEKLTKKDIYILLNKCTTSPTYGMVGALVADSNFGYEIGVELVKSQESELKACGYIILGHYVSLIKNINLNIEELKKMIDEIVISIKLMPNEVKKEMNSFIISVGSSVEELYKYAYKAGLKIGKVDIDVGNTACITPAIVTYLEKVANKNKIGHKKKQARC